jgi:arsenate reductase
MIIYGIKNCDTMKKALLWLDANKVTYLFHDYKKEGISPEKISEWLKEAPVNTLINTKGTTYKKLSDIEKANITQEKTAVELMVKNPSMIKRPLLETKQGIVLGFDAAAWEKLLL